MRSKKKAWFKLESLHNLSAIKENILPNKNENGSNKTLNPHIVSKTYINDYSFFYIYYCVYNTIENINIY